MHELDGAVRSYAWGSRTAIARLRGLPVPTAHPEAELWLGAHPAGPARVVTDEGPRSLLEVVRENPARELGSRSLEDFGDRLPFLLKLLAAEEPLSLQAHPSAAQAREGFARENAAGIPLGSSIRNYRDDSHKPELVVALTTFEALAGFRRPDRTVKLLGALGVPELEPYVALLAGQPDSDGLRALFTTWITLPPPVLAALMPGVLDGCVAYLAAEPDGEFADEVRTALELSEAYPGDTGVLASLLLNRVRLEPGQGLYLDAGNLHAYLHGVGVEIMANSDNVLRGGLTPKHVDVPELLRVLDFDSAPAPFVEPVQVPGTGKFEYDTPAPEFELSRIELTDASTGPNSFVLGGDGPRVLLCTAGTATLVAGDRSLELSQGAAAWIAAEDPEVVITPLGGRVQLFSASTGRLRT
ncbi:mannose-6-phosphate isomerase, class I [Rhodococcus triatomae]|uniref:mannose-6-phosphate isomerase n=1 Tax=Rhodococcus triatomae TaxID=300028 RepID=A0A1G8FAV5_9NOCA|nr:mannose-6-phosphate isomerase, class I [Rhodococcus triatomae]QNG19436.1 mannose-6-phosphate isomerase, class I [Rhodococcus triatomae]QNG24650.1 mannose-6-phosphate isomerase, class I [Rhodococcus triatomae]SDH79253.1 mannose-6-phosphate isomerase [Rhodococcus triatomae]